MGGLSWQIDHARRLLLTGLSFLVFGLQALLIGIIGVPVLALICRDSVQRQQRVRALIGAAMRGYIALLQWLGLMTLRVQMTQPDPSDPIPGLLVANHPSLLDAVIMVGRYPQADVIVKAGLYRNPFIRLAALGAGYLSNADPLDTLIQAQTRLTEGHTLIIFPEGTRTEPGQSPEFKLGAAALAVRSQRACRLIALHCTPATLSKDHRWFHIPAHKLIYDISIGPIIEVAPATSIPERRRATRALNRQLNQWVNNELSRLAEQAPVANLQMNGHHYPLTKG